MQQDVVSEKTNQFRLNIRRKQIESFFQAQRKKFFQQNHLKEEFNVHQQLKTFEVREEWISEVAKILDGQIKNDWPLLLTKLHHSAKSYCFQHDIWLELGITRTLIYLLILPLNNIHSQNLSLYRTLSKQAAKILTDLIYLNNSPQINNPTFAHKIYEESPFIGQLVELCRKKEKIEVEYLRLLGQMIERQKIRQIFIMKGGVQIVLELLGYVHELQTQENMTTLYLAQQLVSQFLPHQYYEGLLDILTKHIFFSYSEPYLYEIIFCIFRLLRENIPQGYAVLYKYQRKAIKKILQLMEEMASSRIRAYCSKIIAQLLYESDETHCLALISEGLIQKVYGCCLDESAQQVMIELLGILSNFTADDEVQSQLIMEHPILQVVLTHASSNNSLLKKESTYILCNLLQTYKQSTFQVLAHKYGVLKLVAENVMEELELGRSCSDSLKTISTCIEKARSWYPHQNYVLHLVDSIGLVSLVESIYNEANGNCEEEISIFINALTN